MFNKKLEIMAKTSGGVRTYRQGSSTYLKRQAEVEAMRASGKYSSIEMSKGGGYVVIEKSTARHMPEELEAARILADKGYKVILKDEATGLHGVKHPTGIYSMRRLSRGHRQRTARTRYGMPCFTQGIKSRCGTDLL